MEIYSHFSLAPSVESRGKAAGMRCGPGDMGRWQRAAAAIDLPSVLPAHFWKSSKLLPNTYLIFYFPPPFCSQGPRRSGRQILCCMHNLCNVWIPITVTYCVGKFNSTRWSVGSSSAFIYAIVINSPGARLTPVWQCQVQVICQNRFLLAVCGKIAQKCNEKMKCFVVKRVTLDICQLCCQVWLVLVWMFDMSFVFNLQS